jgi:hypothetical protein
MMQTFSVTTPEQRVRKARKVALDAIAHAQVIRSNPELTRATRTRASYKWKADALDKVALILQGKDGF